MSSETTNDPRSKDISAYLLQNILQIGQLDYEKSMHKLMKLTHSKSGQFFQKGQTGSLFMCTFSTSQLYKVGDKYMLDNLPINQYTIFHRNTIIAIICLENQDILDELPDDIQQRIHDSICIGLVMGTLRDSKYSFTISVCNALSNIISQVIDMFDNMALKIKSDKKYVDQINTYLNDVITIIYDTIDYLEIDAEKVNLEKNNVDLNEFLLSTSSKYEGIFRHKVTTELDERANRSFIFDKRWVQQMLISVLKKLVDIPNLQLHVSINGNILNFRIYSTISRYNVELMKKVQVDRISVTSLDIFVVKRLCDIMNGKFEVETDGIIITIAVDRS